MSLTITSTKVDAASDSAGDIFAALHAHFTTSAQFNSILPAPTTDHTIYIEPAGSEPWRFALSTVGAETNFLAASMEPDKAAAPDGLNPSTGATAGFSGVAGRFAGFRSRFMMVTEITGDARDAVFIHFYTNSSGTRAYPFRDSLHFGRILSPKISDVPGLDGLGMISGVASLRVDAASITGSTSAWAFRNTAAGQALSRSRMRVGPTDWRQIYWPGLADRDAAAMEVTLQGRIIVEPLDCGSNSTGDTSTAANTSKVPKICVFSHVVMTGTNKIAGATVIDTTNGREWLAAADSSTTTALLASARNQLVCAFEPGTDPAP
jgi:hypothetical protein